jgi:hypothetical protein
MRRRGTACASLSLLLACAAPLVSSKLPGAGRWLTPVRPARWLALSTALAVGLASVEFVGLAQHSLRTGRAALKLAVRVLPSDDELLGSQESPEASSDRVRNDGWTAGWPPSRSRRYVDASGWSQDPWSQESLPSTAGGDYIVLAALHTLAVTAGCASLFVLSLPTFGAGLGVRWTFPRWLTRLSKRLVPSDWMQALGRADRLASTSNGPPADLWARRWGPAVVWLAVASPLAIRLTSVACARLVQRRRQRQLVKAAADQGLHSQSPSPRAQGLASVPDFSNVGSSLSLLPTEADAETLAKLPKLPAVSAGKEPGYEPAMQRGQANHRMGRPKIVIGPRGHYLGADNKPRRLPKIYQRVREGTARLKRSKIYCDHCLAMIITCHCLAWCLVLIRRALRGGVRGRVQVRQGRFKAQE